MDGRTRRKELSAVEKTVMEALSAFGDEPKVQSIFIDLMTHEALQFTALPVATKHRKSHRERLTVATMNLEIALRQFHSVTSRFLSIEDARSGGLDLEAGLTI